MAGAGVDVGVAVGARGCSRTITGVAVGVGVAVGACDCARAITGTAVGDGVGVGVSKSNGPRLVLREFERLDVGVGVSVGMGV